jgi:hypothetical protein
VGVAAVVPLGGGTGGRAADGSSASRASRTALGAGHRSGAVAGAAGCAGSRIGSAARHAMSSSARGPAGQGDGDMVAAIIMTALPRALHSA